MTYASLLEREGISSQFLAIIKPRIKITSWTLISGTKYKSSFTFGEIISITKDGTTQTLASDSTLADGTWFYDSSASFLYVDFSVNPSTVFVVATYELYLGTFDAHWYRVPDTNTTRVVYYEPLIIKSPVVNQTASEALFGLLPTQQSQMIISNATHLLQELAYSSSFNECDIDIWHYLDELSVANLKLIFKGICGNIEINDKEISLTVFDRNKVFENEYRHTTGYSFYGPSDFTNLDPNYANRPVKTVFGRVDGLVPTNIDYNISSPSTSNNRNWICIADETNLGSVSTTVPAAPASTTTRTYLTSVVGFNIGDTVWIDSASGAGFDEFVTVTAVGANYIEHAIIVNIAATASVIKRSFVGSVTIYKEGKQYNAKYGRDYTELTNSTYFVAGFTFTATMEANLSIALPLNPNDIVHCRVYGHKNTSTLGGNPFGSNSSGLGNLAQGIVIFWEIMKTKIGFSESSLDTATFTSAQAAITDEFGFQLPESSSNNFPTYRTLIGKIATSLMLKIFLDTNNKWSFAQAGPIVSTTKTVQDDEIILDSWSYDLNYNDVVSKVIVQFAKREVSETNQVSSDSYSRVTAISETALYLHNIKKQNTFTSLHWSEASAQTLADRFSYIFGERDGVVSFQTKNRFFNTFLGDDITVERSRLIGYSYDIDIDRSRDFEVTLTQKSLNNITIDMNDQKGVQDNQGVW